MPEVREGVIRSLLRRITGQTAKEVEQKKIAEQALAERHQQEVALAEKARVKAEDTRKLIQSITKITRVTLPEQLDVARKIDSLENQVSARSIYGKFPPEVRVKDRVFHHDKMDDFREYGDIDKIGERRDALYRFPQQIFRSLLLNRNLQDGELKDLGKKHFILATNIPGTEDSILTYLFVHPYMDFFGRWAPLAEINFRLKQSATGELLELIRKDSEVAEMFLQKAAAGFEYAGSKLGGISRVESDEVVIVNLENFNQNYFNPFINSYNNQPTIEPKGWDRRVELVAGEMIGNSNNQIERYKYSTPHGVMPPNEIRF